MASSDAIEDVGLEILSVSEATDSAFDGHEFAVHAFGHCVGGFGSTSLTTFSSRSLKDQANGRSRGKHQNAKMRQYTL